MENQRLTLTFSTLLLSLFLALVPQSITFAEPLATITVESGKYTRIDTPVSIVLNDMSDVLLGVALRLEEIKGFQRLPVPVQIERGNVPRLLWILSGTTPADSKRVYELVAGESIVVPGVEVKQDDTALEVYSGKIKVLRYNYALIPPPEGASPLYARSGFIHPLWSPSGEVLTCIHPDDHIHHLGLWSAWAKTKFEGRGVDFWNLGSGEGTVRFVKFASKTNGPVFGGFSAISEHVALKAAGGEKVVLNEELDVRVWNVGGPKKEYWLCDFTSSQRCASSSPLYLLKYRYGGFGFRATGEWSQPNSGYLTSEGKTRKDDNETRGRWCNIFGTTANGPAGVAFMSHPQNHGHPEPMRIWPEGDVFFNFCPVQKADWILEPGNDYVLRYRLYVYNGTITSAEVERLWQDFSHPPIVKLEMK